MIDEWQGRIRGIKIEIEKVLKRQDEERKQQEEWKNKYAADQEKNEQWKRKTD